jgi:hypothetical protein
MHDIHHFTPEYWRTWLSSVDWKVFAAGKIVAGKHVSILPPLARPLRYGHCLGLRPEAEKFAVPMRNTWPSI